MPKEMGTAKRCRREKKTPKKSEKKEKNKQTHTTDGVRSEGDDPGRLTRGGANLLRMMELLQERDITRKLSEGNEEKRGKKMRRGNWKRE